MYNRDKNCSNGVGRLDLVSRIRNIISMGMVSSENLGGVEYSKKEWSVWKISKVVLS